MDERIFYELEIYLYLIAAVSEIEDKMAFFGKEYKFEREENYEELVKALDLSESDTKEFLNYKPILKLVKDDDTYTFSVIASNPKHNKELTFKSGVEFDEKDMEYNSKTVFTIVGNTVTQIQKFEDGHIFTYKREYAGDTLIETINTNKWDGVACRYYKVCN